MENKIFSFSTDWSLHKEVLKNDKYYLFNIYDGTIIRLNETSYLFLSMIDGNRYISEILEAVLSIFEVDRDRLETDMNSLINKCINNKIIH